MGHPTAEMLKNSKVDLIILHRLLKFLYLFMSREFFDVQNKCMAVAVLISGIKKEFKVGGKYITEGSLHARRDGNGSGWVVQFPAQNAGNRPPTHPLSV